MNGKARTIITGAIGIIALIAIWELYKALGPAGGVSIGDITVLPRTADTAMPHVWDMIARAAQPINRASNAVPLWQAVLAAGAMSLGIAGVGWVAGVVVGVGLAVLMQRLQVARAAILPWVILSQTVPLIALAPLVKGWGSKLEFGTFDWQPWMSVAVIASYLAFFPVAVGMLRGLSSPQDVHTELFRTYNASWWTTLTKLRFPAAVPYLLPALRLAAANAVVGAIVAEVSTGLKGGLGRMIIEFGQAGSSDPAKAWSPIFGAVLIGLVSAGIVYLIGLTLKRYRYAEVDA
ncbi:ABC transporter permease [Rarobacter incanus]|uniref:NitT/TauT family transport system permease protein n=1 Tax=Rarobacter incanus TaxID=153494 RepID=A0A542SQZ5_9MICO|nr:ABC transporter permease subunit [Rarobacter incanus]TQK77039.1 NitT/TauT family transport system permease protein [Rarobacter incanus]